jgi:hypothetical protein
VIEGRGSQKLIEGRGSVAACACTAIGGAGHAPVLTASIIRVAIVFIVWIYLLVGPSANDLSFPRDVV